MAAKHIIVKALPLPPYHCTTLKKSRHQKNTAIISLHLIVLTHVVFKQPYMQQDVWRGTNAIGGAFGSSLYFFQWWLRWHGPWQSSLKKIPRIVRRRSLRSCAVLKYVWLPSLLTGLTGGLSWSFAMMPGVKTRKGEFYCLFDDDVFCAKIAWCRVDICLPLMMVDRGWRQSHVSW